MEKLVAEKLLNFTFVYANYMKKSVMMHCNKNGKNKNYKLTMPQLHLMICIYNLNNECTLSDIVNVMSISKSTISILLSKLEKQFLIERVHNSDEYDKRKVSICLTEKGIEILDNKKKQIFEYLCLLTNKMDKEDIEYLDATLPKISKILNKYGEREI